MKTRIIEVVEKEYGKVTARWYDVQEFKRNYVGFLIGFLIPFFGWAALLQYKPLKLKWRIEMSFDTKEQAKYYLMKKEMYETIGREVK